jgi:hypothetical protein
MALLLNADVDEPWPVDAAALSVVQLAMALLVLSLLAQVALVWFTPAGWKPCNKQ